MNENGFNTSERADLRGAYKTFVKQMADWYNGGELPELAGQDCFRASKAETSLPWT